MSNKIKFLAYYLPQYHQIPENDEWWGEGFTEWTNVKKAKPLFKGHQQPVEPGELGYYDLLKTEGIQERQSELALEYGIDGFIYYQYWFGGGKMLLEKPAEKMLANKNVKIPFCFCWANETWRGIWHGIDDEKKVLIEQKYLGEEDYKAYFNYLLPFFKDERYIKINGKPLFVIYDSVSLPLDIIPLLNKLASESGFEGIHFMASNRGGNSIDYKTKGFSSKISGDYNVLLDKELFLARRKGFVINRLINFRILKQKPTKLIYKLFFNKLNYSSANVKTFPIVVPNWDNTPRSRLKGFSFVGSKPFLFGQELDKAISYLLNSDDDSFVVIKSWNEWAEGNYIEPDKANRKNWLKELKARKISISKKLL